MKQKHEDEQAGRPEKSIEDHLADIKEEDLDLPELTTVGMGVEPGMGAFSAPAEMETGLLMGSGLAGAGSSVTTATAADWGGGDDERGRGRDKGKAKVKVVGFDGTNQDEHEDEYVSYRLIL